MKNNQEQSSPSNTQLLTIKNNVLIYETKKDASNAIGSLFLEDLKNNSKLSMALSADNSFKDIYNFIGLNWKKAKVSFAHTNIFLTTEFLDLESNQESLFQWLQKAFLVNINLGNKNIFVPSHQVSKNSTNLKEEDFNKEIIKYAPINFELINLGVNGNIVFNEPSINKEDINGLTSANTLSNASITEWTHHFQNKIVPKKVISMGILEIINAKKIIIPVFEITKINALVKLFKATKFDPEWPITALIYAETEVKIYLDRVVYELLIQALKK